MGRILQYTPPLGSVLIHSPFLWKIFWRRTHPLLKIVPVEGHPGVCRMIFLLHLMRWSKAFSFSEDKGASLLYLWSYFEKKDYRTRLSSLQRANPSRSLKNCFNEPLFLQEECDVLNRWSISVKTYCLLDADGHQRSYFHLLEKKVLLFIVQLICCIAIHQKALWSDHYWHTPWVEGELPGWAQRLWGG